jgi:hypothetical protein
MGLIFPLLLLLPGVLVYLVGQIRVSTLDGEPARASGDVSVTSVLPALTAFIGRLALSLLPLVLSAHLALAIVKLNAKFGYLPLALQDPSGVKSFLAINVMQTLTPPGVLISLDILKWVVVVILLTGFLFSVLASRAAARAAFKGQSGTDRPFIFASIVSLVILSGFYGSTVVEWLFVR